MGRGLRTGRTIPDADGGTPMDSKRREVLVPERAPKPLGPYSHGVRSGRWVFTSGTIGNDPPDSRRWHNP